MSQKKIIIYIPNLSGGGTERFYTQLSKFLANIEKFSITYFYSIFSCYPHREYRPTIDKCKVLHEISQESNNLATSYVDY